MSTVATSDAVMLSSDNNEASGSSLVPPSPRRSHTLMTLPPEILDSIAYFCAITTYHHLRTSSECSNCLDGDLDMCANCHLDYNSPAPAYATPPANVRALQLTCRRAHALLNTQANPRLYARLFKIKFDVAAIKRRFGPQAVSSRSLTMELQRRCICLKRIREAVEQGRLRPRGAEIKHDQHEAQWLAESNAQMLENLWLAYMMMVENDGLNLLQLRWAHIEGYLLLHHSQEMLEAAVQPGYPPDTPDRCLALHLSHLLTDPATLAKETRDESEEKLFVLRPFVFAAHKFDAYYAPWTRWTLPIEGNAATHMSTAASTSAATASLPVDHKGKGPATAGTSTESEGSRKKLEREESLEVTQLAQSRATPPPHNPFLADLRPRPREVEITHCGAKLRLAPPILSHAACFSFFAKVERDPAVIGLTTVVVDEEEFSASVGYRANRNPLLFRSADHDKDVARLLACSDPYTSLGFKPLCHAGDFEGAWEGRFSFFDFDSYREMLAGRMRSLYEGPFGEQPQVWKVKEHIVKIDYAHKEGGKGTILNAGYLPRDDEPTDALDYPAEAPEGAIAVDADSSRSRTASYSASASPSASSRRTGPSSSAFGATSPGQQKSTRASSSGLKEPYSANQPHAKVAQQDWQDYPSFGSDEPTENDDDRYEILLSGTGHSAWGRFILRGRVRAWDGMMIMTKEYRPDGRGRWLYRGYAVAGGRLVGRWRDTFTPDNMSGYEGTFLLSRRDNS